MSSSPTLDSSTPPVTQKPSFPPLITVDYNRSFIRDPPRGQSNVGFVPTQVHYKTVVDDIKDFKMLGSVTLAFLTSEYILSVLPAAPSSRFFEVKNRLLSRSHLTFITSNYSLTQILFESLLFETEVDALDRLNPEDHFKIHLGMVYQQKGMNVTRDWVRSVFQISSGMEDQWARVEVRHDADAGWEEEFKATLAREEEIITDEVHTNDIGPSRPPSGPASTGSQKSAFDNGRNYVSVMEEYRVKSKNAVAYTHSQTGPSHKPQFSVQLRVEGVEQVFLAKGESKKAAKNDAAKKAVETLGLSIL